MSIRDLKSSFYHWCQRERVTPRFSSRSIGRRHVFCEVHIPGYSYIGVGNAHNKSAAQYLAVQDFIQNGKEKRIKSKEIKSLLEIPVPEFINSHPTTLACELNKSPKTEENMFQPFDQRDSILIDKDDENHTKINQAENTNLKIENHGNWNFDNAEPELRRFMQKNCMPKNYKYSRVGTNNEMVECCIEFYVKQLERNIGGRGYDSNKEIASKKCALEIILQLFQFGVIEAYSDTFGCKKKISTSSTVSVQKTFDDEAVSNTWNVGRARSAEPLNALRDTSNTLDVKEVYSDTPDLKKESSASSTDSVEKTLYDKAVSKTQNVDPAKVVEPLKASIDTSNPFDTMISSYCRLCMSEEDLNVIDSFSLKAIRNEFSIEVQQNDKLSKEICNNCSDFILNLIDFKKNVINVQKVLNKMLKKNPNVSTYEVTPNENNNTNEPTIETELHEEVINKENSSDRSSEDAQNSDIIVKLIKSIDFSKVTGSVGKLEWTPKGSYCKVCQTNIKSESEFHKHTKSTSHKFKSNIIDKFGKFDRIKDYYCGYTCTYCTQVFTNKKAIAAHSKAAHGYSLIKRDNLQPDTLVRKQKVSLPSKRSNSNQNTPNVEKSLNNVQIKTEPNSSPIKETNIVNVKAIKCKFCNKSFCFKEAYSRHLQRHHNDFFFCESCDFASKNRQVFAQHIRNQHNLTAVERVCSLCFKKCENTLALHSHRREEHRKGVQYPCTMCEETFPLMQLLKKHKYVAHYAKPESNEPIKELHRCGTCNRNFQSKLVMQLHQCRAKKFACLKKCGKRFELFSKMESHMKKCVNGKTIFSCQRCKKNLSCLQTLKTHMDKCQVGILSRPSESAKDDLKQKKKQNIDSENIVDLTEPSETKNSKSSLRCKKCTKKFFAIVELENHYSVCAGASASTSTNYVKCSCGALFANEKVLQLHKMIDHRSNNGVAKKPSKKKSKDESSGEVEGNQVGFVDELVVGENVSHQNSEPKSRNIEDESVEENRSEKGETIIAKKNIRSKYSKVTDDAILKKKKLKVKKRLKVGTKLRKTVSCIKCGVVFNSKKYLSKHVCPNAAESSSPKKSKTVKPTKKSIIKKRKKPKDGSNARLSVGFDNQSLIHEPGEEDESSMCQNNVNFQKSTDRSDDFSSNIPIRSQNNTMNGSNYLNSSSGSLDSTFSRDSSRNSTQFVNYHNKSDTGVRSYRPNHIKFDNNHQDGAFSSHHSPNFQHFDDREDQDSSANTLWNRNSNQNSQRFSKNVQDNQWSNNRNRGFYSEQLNSRRFENGNFHDPKFQNQWSQSPNYARNGTSSYNNYNMEGNNRLMDKWCRSLSNSDEHDGPFPKNVKNPDFSKNSSTPVFDRLFSNKLSFGSNKSREQSAGIPNDKGICQICKNLEPHLFCEICKTCYKNNQNQYNNHMRMKHS